MLKNLGSIEVIIVGFILLLLFGSKKLSDLARGLGESSKEFKKVKKEYEKAVSGQEKEPAAKEDSTEDNAQAGKTESKEEEV